MNIELSQEQAQLTIDALTEKNQRAKKQSDLYRDQLSRHFMFIQDQSQEVRLEFAKHVYLNTFDENALGRDAEVFQVAVDVLEPIAQCAEDKEFFLQINDYIFRLEECIKQLKQTGTIYDTMHLLGYELDYDFGYNN